MHLHCISICCLASTYCNIEVNFCYTLCRYFKASAKQPISLISRHMLHNLLLQQSNSFDRGGISRSKAFLPPCPLARSGGSLRHGTKFLLLQALRWWILNPAAMPYQLSNTEVPWVRFSDKAAIDHIRQNDRRSQLTSACPKS